MFQPPHTGIVILLWWTLRRPSHQACIFKHIDVSWRGEFWYETSRQRLQSSNHIVTDRPDTEWFGFYPPPRWLVSKWFWKMFLVKPNSWRMFTWALRLVFQEFLALCCKDKYYLNLICFWLVLSGMLTCFQGLRENHNSHFMSLYLII